MNKSPNAQRLQHESAGSATGPASLNTQRQQPQKGSLIVFEGPDGVGKSTLAGKVADYLREIGSTAEQFSFPGQTIGTLGKHIYDLYHSPDKYGIEGMQVNTEQTLFTAAHVETIESQILPTLAHGTNVILDRYWWSTWVYATAASIDPKLRELLIEIEQLVWKNTSPACIFYIRRPTPINFQGRMDKWKQLRSLYEDLRQREDTSAKVFDINNVSTLEQATITVCGFAASMVRSPRSETKVTFQ